MIHSINLKAVKEWGKAIPEFEVVFFWLVAPRNLVVGDQRFGGRAASIFRVDIRGQGDVSIALLPTQTGS
jgi:hypothetical protein